MPARPGSPKSRPEQIFDPTKLSGVTRNGNAGILRNPENGVHEIHGGLQKIADDPGDYLRKNAG